MSKFNQCLTELSARDASGFSFPGDNLSKYQWIFTKLAMCIDIIDIWFGIAGGRQFLIVFSPRHIRIFVSSGQ